MSQRTGGDLIVKNLDWPLMENNIERQDLDALIHFLKGAPRLTQSEKVAQFEKAWSEWVGVKHSVFVNSGSSANQITLAALRECYGEGEVILPALTWVSDIAATLQAGFRPVFVDISPRTLGMDETQVMERITSKTRAVFLTHILGFPALSKSLLKKLSERSIPLLEDACESHGAVFAGKRVGSFGLMSNFSFYYAHHLSTIEGGMVCTQDEHLYRKLRMFRSHGLVREADSEAIKKEYVQAFPDLNPEFIFAFPAYNVRSTEINAVLGMEQLKRLDSDILLRNENFTFFLDRLDGRYYRTEFQTEGMSNYALVLILRDPNVRLRDAVMEVMTQARVEFRRGTSGGGNQLRQPYLRKHFPEDLTRFPEVEHVHFYGFYIGNYPGLSKEKIERLCELLNREARQWG